VYQLLGTSGFYANDIDSAEKYLAAGLDIYKRNEARPVDLYPRAFTSHFLGLIAKNWLKEGRSIDATLIEARGHLEEAAEQLKEKPGEFLTPVTLAEVQGYIEADRPIASQRLAEHAEALRLLRESKPSGLDENQQAIYGRVFMYSGNLKQLSGDLEGARRDFAFAVAEGAGPFAVLSQAATETGQERHMHFLDGLQALESSEAFKKPEITGRGVALAWATIASHETKDEVRSARYLKDLTMLQVEARSAGGRQPLFFSPISKTLCLFEKLKEETVGFVSSAVTS
jgi:hypothetical protein